MRWFSITLPTPVACVSTSAASACTLTCSLTCPTFNVTGIVGLGEALGQAQRVAAEREALARLLSSTDPARAGDQRGKIGRMFARLTDAHAARMAALGLAD